MIAGETETILSREAGTGHYDNFLFFGKKDGKKKPKREKKQLTPEEQEAKRARRQQFWSNLGESFKEGGTVSNIVGLFGGGRGAPAPEDYEMSVGDQAGNQPPAEKKGLPTGVLVVGGVVVLAVAYFGYQQFQKNQQLKLAQAQ